MQPMHTAQREAGRTTFKNLNHSFPFLKAVSEKNVSLDVLVSNSVRKLKNSTKLLNCVVGVVKFFKVPFGKLISRVFYPNSLATPLIFPLASIWRLKAASNLEAAKSTLLYKSCSNQKIIMDLLLKLLKFE